VAQKLGIDWANSTLFVLAIRSSCGLLRVRIYAARRSQKDTAGQASSGTRGQRTTIARRVRRVVVARMAIARRLADVGSGIALGVSSMMSI
jgi:hypothetical protein